MTGALVQDFEFHVLAAHAGDPPPASPRMERDLDAPAIHGELSQRSSRAQAEGCLDALPVDLNLLAVQLNDELTSANHHEVLHVRSRMATVSMWAV
jgi:hypothetical protein